MNDPIDEEFLQIYLEECGEGLDEVTDVLLRLENDPENSELVAQAFRILHTFKGSSGMMGFDRINALAHEIETRFDAFRARREWVTPESVTLTLRCVDFFREFLDRLAGGDVDEGDPRELADAMRLLHSVPFPSRSETEGTVAQPDGVSGPALMGVEIQFEREIERIALKVPLIQQRLGELGTLRHASPSLDDVDTIAKVGAITAELLTEANAEEIRSALDVVGVIRVEAIALGESESVAADIADPPATAASSVPEAVPTADPEIADPEIADSEIPDSVDPDPVAAVPVRSGGPESVRVGIDRLDSLMNLAGELVVANARFVQLADEMGKLFRGTRSMTDSSELPEPMAEWVLAGRRLSIDWGESVDQLSRLSKSIQHAVLDTRMVPIGPLLNRYRRTVRDLSVEHGKSVQLLIEGESTELDKRMVDELGDPLMHLVRNAFDHGIESEAERLAAHKPTSGTIVISAHHEGNQVVVRLRDDGGGLCRESIAATAVRRGLADPNSVKMMTDAQVHDFIWQPGFSTAAAATELSGRGVGMDVVRNRIASLGGNVETESVPGQGTTFTLRLPLTLAIVNSLIVTHGRIQLAIPTTGVQEVLAIAPEEIYAAPDGSSLTHEMIRIRGKFLPLYRLETLFRWPTPTPATGIESDQGPGDATGVVEAVVVRAGNRSLALVVDGLKGNLDIVIKPLSDLLTGAIGLSGACVLGDGQVCLVVDLAGLAMLTNRQNHEANPLALGARR